MARQARQAASPPDEDEADQVNGGADSSGEPLSVIDLDDNLEDVEKPPELPANAYTAEVQDVQIKVSGKGNRYFNIKLLVPNDELPANIREHFPDGAVMYYNRLIVPRAGDRRDLYNMKQWIAALGLSTSTTSVDPNEWMGQECRIRVVMGTYQNVPRAEIRSVEPVAPKAAPRGGKPVARAGKR